MEPATMTFVIRGCRLAMIDDDTIAPAIMKHNDFVENPQPRRRASHVEPGEPGRGQDARLWYADLSPVNGPVLGGFPTRRQALDAEIEWLNQHTERWHKPLRNACASAE